MIINRNLKLILAVLGFCSISGILMGGTLKVYNLTGGRDSEGKVKPRFFVYLDKVTIGGSYGGIWDYIDEISERNKVRSGTLKIKDMGDSTLIGETTLHIEKEGGVGTFSKSFNWSSRGCVPITFGQEKIPMSFEVTSTADKDFILRVYDNSGCTTD